jgi:hypothetical protein
MLYGALDRNADLQRDAGQKGSPMSIQEFLMKAAEEDARRAGERNRLLRDALRVRAGNGRRSGPRVAAASTHLAMQVARCASWQLSHALAVGHTLPRGRPDLFVPNPAGPGLKIGDGVLEDVSRIANGDKSGTEASVGDGGSSWIDVSKSTRR